MQSCLLFSDADCLEVYQMDVPGHEYDGALPAGNLSTAGDTISYQWFFCDDGSVDVIAYTEFGIEDVFFLEDEYLLDTDPTYCVLRTTMDMW